MDNDHEHAGIKCLIADNKDLCEVIGTVLDGVEMNRPADLERIRKRLLHFEAMRPGEGEFSMDTWGMSELEQKSRVDEGQQFDAYIETIVGAAKERIDQGQTMEEINEVLARLGPPPTVTPPRTELKVATWCGVLNVPDDVDFDSMSSDAQRELIDKLRSEEQDEDQKQGYLEVNPEMPSDRFGAPNALFQMAGIAHELGRSIATKADLSERLAPGDDWAEKAAANYYAFRWGMADMIAEARGRQAHPRFTLWLCGTFADAFAVLPGFEPEARGETSRPPLGDPSVYWWRVDDEFVFHHCPVCRGWPTFDEACRHPLEEYERGCPRSFRFSENG